MKTCKFLLLATVLVTATTVHAQTRPSASEETPPTSTTNVYVPTTASELATGYATAIQQMTLKSLVIYLKSEGKTVAIRGLRSAKAMGAVLLIEFSAGDRMAVNAEQIVMITDGTRTP